MCAFSMFSEVCGNDGVGFFGFIDIYIYGDRGVITLKGSDLMEWGGEGNSGPFHLVHIRFIVLQTRSIFHDGM